VSKRTKNLGRLSLAAAGTGPCECSFTGATFNGDTRVDLAPPGNGPRFRVFLRPLLRTYRPFVGPIFKVCNGSNLRVRQAVGECLLFARNCRSRRTLQIAVFNRNRVLLSPVGPDTPRRLGRMIGAARDCSRARKRVARRKRSLDRLVECAFSLRAPFTPRPLRCLPHAKSLPCLRLAAQLAKRRCVRVREEASRVRR
jgi:hypothetical protein